MRSRYVIMDLVTSFIAFFLFLLGRYKLTVSDASGISYWEYISAPKMIAEQCLIPIAMLGIYWLSGYYNHPFGKSRLQEFFQTLSSAAFNTIWIYLALLINDQFPNHRLNYELIGILFFSLLFMTYIGRYILTHNSIKNIEKNKWGFNTVIIGDSPDAIASSHKLQNTQKRLGYNIIGFVHIEGEKVSASSHEVLTNQQLDDLCKDGRVDTVIIMPEADSSEKKILEILQSCLSFDVPIKIRPSALAYVTSHIRTGDIYGEPFIDLSSPSISDFQINAKRVLDISLSWLALIITSPLLLGLAIGVKFSSKGPVIYRQERIGYRNKPFKILKFRTMVIDAEADGPQLSSDNDSRVTPIGRVMRKFRLDELPQFWNVIKGEMSIVGPRPEREYYIDKIIPLSPQYSLLHQVKPGITSWGMVKYGYASSVEEMVERSYFDLIYLSNMSILVDFKILLHTISTVIHGKGK